MDAPGDRVRRAAREAVDDVEPPAFRDRLVEHVTGGSVAAGEVTLAAATAERRRLGEPAPDPTVTVGDRDRSPLDCAVAVQAIYRGLELTRSLAQAPPWTDGRTVEGDEAVLVADVLVARGMHCLARTAAADRAVATIRSFGHDHATDVDRGDYALERDTFELAVEAGVSAVGGRPGPRLRNYAADLVGEGPPSVPETVVDDLVAAARDPPGSEGARSQADH
ncbi:DUF7114 family protein [Halococcoides cellulosivorans]|uniref:Uncharacterized protein n=1 Tax=Halococcoides cellulosivorans TaxID=1679096 RepID=A0A2R4WYB9_9EURY|nr:hypothetical protein [Halococcoides cellulosivorans]AWB26537.1 hypothetical protein HARCEL1_01825 [Halococcoides cellulosivorans]